MGLCSRYKSLTCNSCSMHCQIMSEESPRLQYTAQTRVFVCGPKKVHILIVVW